MDEAVIVTVQGEGRYLWRAVDPDDNVIDMMVQKRKDKKPATRFFRKAAAVAGLAAGILAKLLRLLERSRCLQ